MSTDSESARRYDLVVVGAGPAGLTAGIYGARALLKTLVLDAGAPGGQLLRTAVIDDYPGFREIPGSELAERMADHAKAFGASFQYGSVERILPGVGQFTVQTSDGTEYICGAVIVCTGGRPRKLGVSGEDHLFGRGVSYCALCDGPFFKNKTVLVVGGGDSAVEEAIYLTRFAKEVHMYVLTPELTAAPQWRQTLAANPKITIHYNTIVREIGGDNKVEWLKIRSTQSGEESRVQADGVFIYVGFEPQLETLPPDVEVDDHGLVVTDENMQTNLPGLFVSGDIHSHPVRHITAAVADATVAAISAYKYLRATEEEGGWRIIGMPLPSLD